jgi:fucose permease
MEPKPAVVKLQTRAWVYPVGVAAISLIGFQYAPAFDVPAGPMGWLTMPGVLLALATAVLACLLFFHCPKRPSWVKILTLAFSLPALFLAVDSVICHVDMLMTKRPNRMLQGTPGFRSGSDPGARHP